MTNCEKCKYYVDDKFLGECKLINKIRCRSKLPVWKYCPFRSNHLELINYIISNFGDLELKFGKIADKVFVVARLQKKANMFNSDVIEVEGNQFFSIEDALADALYLLWERWRKHKESNMLSSFKVDEYLKVDNLNRVNLITGRNNTGKTTFLRGIFHYCLDVINVPVSFIMSVAHVERSGDRRIKVIGTALEESENGIVLVDEIESNIHFSRYKELWELIREKAIKHNCQVFATTLSYECIASAFEVFSKYEPYELSFYNFSYKDFAIMVTYYDKETLQSALELGLEIRG